MRQIQEDVPLSLLSNKLREAYALFVPCVQRVLPKICKAYVKEDRALDPGLLKVLLIGPQRQPTKQGTIF